MMHTHILFLLISCVFVKGQGPADPIGPIDHVHPHPDPRGPVTGSRFPSIISSGSVTDLSSGSTNTLSETRPDGTSVSGDIGVSGGIEPAGAPSGTPAAAGAETQGFVSDSGAMSVGTAGGGAARAGGFVGGTMNAGAAGAGGLVGGTLGGGAPDAGGFVRSAMGGGAVGADVGSTMNVGAPGSGGFVGSTMNRGAPGAGAGGFVGSTMNRGAPGPGGFVGSTMNRGAPGAGGFVGGTLGGGARGTGGFVRGAMGGGAPMQGGFVGSTMNRGAIGTGGLVGSTMNRGAAGTGGFVGSTMTGGTPNTMRSLSDPLRVPGGVAGGRDPRLVGSSGFVGGAMGGTGVAGAADGLSMRGSSRPTITSSRAISIPSRGPFYDESGRQVADPNLFMRTSGVGFAPSADGARTSLTPGLSSVGSGVGAITSTGGMATGRLMSGGIPARRLDGGRGLGPIIESGSPGLVGSSGLVGAGIPPGAGFVRGGSMTGLDPMAGGPVSGMTRVDPLTGRLILGSSLTGAPFIGAPAGRPVAGSTLTGASSLGATAGRPLAGPSLTGAPMIGAGIGMPLTGPTGAGDVRYIPGTVSTSATGASRIGGLTGGAVRTMDGGFVSGVGGALPTGSATAGTIYPGPGGALATGFTSPGVVYTGLPAGVATTGAMYPGNGRIISTGGGAFSTTGGATALPDGIVMSGRNASSAVGGSMGIVGGSPGVGLTSIPRGSIVLPADMRGSGGRVVYERRLLGGSVAPGLVAPGTTVSSDPRFSYFVPFSGPRVLPGSSLYPTGGLSYFSGPTYRPGIPMMSGFTRGPGIIPGFARGPGFAPPMFSSYPFGARPFF